MFLLRVRDPHGYAPIPELARAQHLRPLEPAPPVDRLMDRVEAGETLWRHAEASENGETPALALLGQAAEADAAPALAAPDIAITARDEAKTPPYV